MSRVRHMSESYAGRSGQGLCALKCHSNVGRDSFICGPWLIHMCAMTHSHVCHDSFTCVPWCIHMCAMTHLHLCHDSFTCVPWLICMYAMTHAHVCHDSFTFVTWLYSVLWLGDVSIKAFLRVTWLIQIWDKFVCVPWLIHMCDMTHSNMRHDSFIRVPWLDCTGCLDLGGSPLGWSCHIYKWVMAHIQMSHGTHTDESWHT